MANSPAPTNSPVTSAPVTVRLHEDQPPTQEVGHAPAEQEEPAEHEHVRVDHQERSSCSMRSASPMQGRATFVIEASTTT